MNPNFSKEVKNYFIENCEDILRRHLPSKFVDEYFGQRNFVKIKLNSITGVYLEELEIHSQAKYEICATAYIQYKHYHKFDKESDSWLLKNVPETDSRVNIKTIKAIFRNEISNPYSTVIGVMKKNDINAIFLKTYSGGVSEKQFIKELTGVGLLVEFVK